ncbi:S-adenosyl-L-methionine-dependent methyltransferase [Hysterangium stoloniferum]|nr:S-adenosyl-L-methionine-dependent methyltransferase [Hysterangium stoloniferum]
MKLSNAFCILADLRIAIQQAFKPTLIELLRSPSLVFRPHKLSQIFFYHLWKVFGDGTNQAGHQVKTDLIIPHAKGVVLDLGAGMGHTMLYLDSHVATKYVAVEPNLLMHPHIRTMAADQGFSEESGSLIILSCGAEDCKTISDALGGLHQVDTIISILTLCSVPRPQHTIKVLVDKVLKPGGQLLFFEHVASKRRDVLFWQRFWTPIWRTCFDGCVLDRPTDNYIRDLPFWEPFPGLDSDGNRMGLWGKEGEIEENLWWHQAGRLVKRAVQ